MSEIEFIEDLGNNLSLFDSQATGKYQINIFKWLKSPEYNVKYKSLTNIKTLIRNSGFLHIELGIVSFIPNDLARDKCSQWYKNRVDMFYHNILD